MSQAKQILEAIINDFSDGGFIRFFREKSRQFAALEENYSRYGDDDFKNGLKLGEINFSDGDSLIICVFEVKKELSERAGKKAQYEKAKNILKSAENQKFSAGIFVFYDSGGNFRFSLVYPESIGARRQWSNFRRFTYFVSREFTNKTFLQRIGGGDFSSLDKVKDAFSVEKVTKEFYLEYHRLFENLLAELSHNHTFLNEASKNGLDAENFAKKLLGQIVFLYFIQKKGWLGVPEGGRWGQGDKNFLSSLFNRSQQEKKNFFRNYLEQLFYNALNKKSDRAGTFYRSKFDCQIPFLNGGLFEAEYKWKDSFIYLDDKIFQAIFDVFDRYNFTVEEESPDDKEIAVDPEMLGKVFENLLHENLRKGKGTYYTPREIVYYMCQESLINYLVAEHSNLSEENIRTYIKYGEALSLSKDMSELNKIWKGESFISGQWKELDDLLKNIKVVDPACGSGAFLVCMLNLIVKLRLFLQLTLDSELYSDPSENTIKQIPEYELKKETIQNCIYGVDIDPGAIEIAKLRLWLSLVVDYELEDIEPLPNLDYKVMQGNSLLEELVLGGESIKLFDPSAVVSDKKMKNLFEEDKKADLFGEADKQQAIIQKLNQMHRDYFALNEIAEKHRLKKEIDKIEYSLIEHSVQKELKRLDLQNKNLGDYITPGIGMQKAHAVKFQKNISTQAQIMNVLDDLKNSGVKPFFLWHLNFAEVFIGNNPGFDIVIANPPYVDYRKIDPSTKAGLLRYESSQKTKMGNLYIYFIELGVKISNPSGVICYINPHQYLTSDSTLGLREFLIRFTSILRIVDLSDLKVFDSASVYTSINFFTPQAIERNKIQVVVPTTIDDLYRVDFEILQEKIKRDPNLLIVLNTHTKLLEKIEANSQKLGLLCDVFVGSSSSGLKRINQDDFMRSDKHMDEFCLFLQSSNIHRYFINKNAQHISKKEYPKGVREKFKKEKIFLARMTKDLRATYSDSEECAGKVNVLVDFKKNPKYILGLLNSELINFWYKSKFESRHLSGGYLGFDIPSVKSIPLKVPQSEKSIIDLIDKILAITKDDDYLQNPAKQEQVKKYERKIDEMVYKLYGLNGEEVRIVEKNIKI